MTQEEMIQFMYNKIVGLDDRFQSIDDRFQSIDDRFQSIDDRFQSMEDKITSMGKDVEEIKVSAHTLERRVTNIELTLENEIRRNISIIAENHIELNKKLNEVLKYDCEREKSLIRLNTLETKVRELQDKEAIA